MAINKESELMNSVVVFFHRCEEEGDYNALFEMGFGPKEVRALSSLSVSDMLRLTSTKSHFLNIQLNRDIYWRMIDYTLREKERESVIDDLILCGAPLQLIRFLTGMGSKQFKIRRRQLGLSPQPPGRPALPTLETEKRVWKEVEALIDQTPGFGPREFLGIYYALDRQVSLRIIWNLFDEWDHDGTLKRLSKS